jgi:DNA polymerase elongation subunit (family B)
MDFWQHLLDYYNCNAQKYTTIFTDDFLLGDEYYWIGEFDVTYVDAILEKDKNKIEVVERVNGKRLYTSWPSRYVTYFPSERGKYTSIFGEKMEKFETTRAEEFQRELRIIPKEKQYESDINPIFRCFYDHYKDAPSPKLNVAFFDIETSSHPELGFSSPEEAFNAVTAISVYLNWLDKNFTLVLKPDTLTDYEAQQIVDKFDDSVLCENETELLDTFLSLIDDADILTGWNSESYDIPYLVNRIVQVMSKEHTKRFCLWNKYPRKRDYKSYGKDAVTYDLVGRVHLDYLQLYRKHTYHEMHSYRLDFVGEYEVKEKKIAYEGSLDTLYNNDFEKFIEYSRQDVMLLVKIDKKLKFIDLSNDLAHTNGVLLATTLGSVLLIDNAITNEAHDLGMVIPARIREEIYSNDDDDEDEDENNEPHGIAGAFVADPVRGMHNWIGGVDINSLYPSAIRALNMSRETVVGQIRPTFTDKYIWSKLNVRNLNDKGKKEKKKSFADAWNDMFGTLEYNMVMKKEKTILTVDFEDKTTVEISAEDLYEWIFNNKNKSLIISANGTIFDLGKEGIVPGLLKKWYSERLEFKRRQKTIGTLSVGIEIPTDMMEEVNNLLKSS